MGHSQHAHRRRERASILTRGQKSENRGQKSEVRRQKTNKRPLQKGRAGILPAVPRILRGTSSPGRAMRPRSAESSFVDRGLRIVDSRESHLFLVAGTSCPSPSLEHPAPSYEQQRSSQTLLTFLLLDRSSKNNRPTYQNQNAAPSSAKAGDIAASSSSSSSSF
jgi:hypothetical protein